MELALGTGLSTSVAQISALAGQQYRPPIVIEPLSQPLVVFDSGAARGENSADIPLQGTALAPDGATVEARLVQVNNGQEVQPWQPIGSMLDGGWSGVYVNARRHPGRLRAQVRILGQAGLAEVGDIMVGHVVCLIGQSEDSRMFDPLFDDREWQTVPDFDDDTVFLLTRDHRPGGAGYAETGVVPIRPGAPHTAAMAHMARVFALNAPGEKLLILDATMAGTSRTALVDDTNVARDWVETLADGVALIRSWGGDVGVVMDSWTAADSAPGDNFATRFYPVYAGMTRDGSVFQPGTTMSDGGNPYRIDHFLWDLTGANRPEALFDADVTKLAFHGPHRFEDFQMDEAGNYLPALRTQKEETRGSIRGMVADPLLQQIMRPKGPEILLYQNGSPTVSTEWTGNRYADGFDPNPENWRNWTDFSHPSTHSDDGLTARARHTGIAALFALDRVAHEVPKLNRAEWRPEFAELWYEDSIGGVPELSTTRLERGESRPTSAFPHRTEVAGFQIDGVPAHRVEIVAGRIRIYPNEGSFDGNSRIDFGLGGGSGIVVAPEDSFDAIWKDLPIAKVDVTGVEGLALEPIPNQEDIKSTLPADGKFMTDGTVMFRDPALIPSNTSAITWRWRVTPDSGGVTLDLGGIEAVRLYAQRVPNGRIRILMMDASGTIVVPSTNTYLTDGTMADIVICVDLAVGKINIWKDGEATDELSISTSSTEFESNRSVQFLSGSGSKWVGAVEKLEVWFAKAHSGNTGDLGEPHWKAWGISEAPYFAESEGPSWLVSGQPSPAL